MSYTQVFGSGQIQPSDVSYSALAISVDTTLLWPLEAQPNEPIVTEILEIAASAGSLSVFMPSALKVSTGEQAVINNTGAFAFALRDQSGNMIVNVAAGQVWIVYLYNNSTADGLWRTFQFGAGTATANAAALAGYGLKAILSTLNVNFIVQTINSNYAIQAPDRANLMTWTGGVGTITLPVASTVENGFVVGLANAGSGSLTLDRNGALINGAAADLTVDIGTSFLIVTDGADWYTVGMSSSSGGGGGGGYPFQFVVVDVAGTGNYVLSAGEQNKIGYQFTGILTGNREIEVPSSAQEYWVDNSTTGAYTLSLRTSTQTPPGYTVTQGSRAILYCDGSDVKDADSGGIATPIAIADGGTGATTASGARTNLGATAVGGALFTAASAQAARSTLDVMSAQEVVAMIVGLS